RGVRKMKVSVAAEQAQQQMIQVAEQPAALHADPVGRGDLEAMPQGQLIQQVGKIDTSIKGELQGSPEAAVHLHQERSPGSTILFVLHHRDAVPAERTEHVDRIVPVSRVERYALAQHTDTAVVRLFPEFPVW